MENKMNFIKEIIDVIDDRVECVKFAFWSDELAVYIWEKEIPISVFPKELNGYGRVILDVEGYDWKLTTYQIIQLGKIMQILQDNIEEIRKMME